VSQKNVPPLACYNFDTHKWILIFFGRNVTDKVGNQKTLYYATSSNLCFCTTWQNVVMQKSHFHSVGLCYTHNAPTRCLPERKNCHLWCVWKRVTFVEIVRYPINTVRWLSLKAWRRTTPIFSQRLTQWQTWLIHSMWATNSRMLCSLPRSCLVHTVDRFDIEGWFSSDKVIFLTALYFLVKKHSEFKWKDAISGFPVRRGGKNKVCFDCLLSHQHFCQKLLQSNRVCKDYSKSKVGRFFET